MEASAHVKKQIQEANRTTLKTYARVIVSANAVFAVMNILFYSSSNVHTCVMFVFSTMVYVGTYRSMLMMAKPVFGDDGSLVDCGVDLNKKYGTAAPLKDVILLTAVIQVLSTISSYFWYLWLLVPVRVLFLFWMMFFSPWLVEDAPEYTWEENEKKLAEREWHQMEQ